MATHGIASSKQLLTFAAITDATGESEHEQLHEIEVIFGAFDEIEPLALRQCRNLERLTLINCSLRRISGLECVGATLLHLSLSDQQLTRIEGLHALVRLRSLCLQQNRIARIEGLDHCRKLQRLWLFGNRIQRVENLAACSDLRELWLQDNAIQTLDCDGSGVSTLVNLASLHVAKNRLRSLDELQDLAFADEHFGSNAIVSQSDYRALVVTTLPHLQRLDGVAIAPTERSDAADQFFAQTLAFNDTLTDLTLAYETDVRRLSAQRERGVSNAERLQRELLQALNELERCVLDGQAQVETEQQRQRHVRDANTQALEAAVEALKQRYHAVVAHQRARETEALEREERALEALEQEAVAEHRLAQCVATLQCAAPETTAYQLVPEHAVDFRHIAAPFEGVAAVRVLQVYRIFHSDLAERFADAVATADATATGSSLELYLYAVASESELPQWLAHGLAPAADGGGDERLDRWLFLFSDPLEALAFYTGTPGTALLADERDDALETMAPRIETFVLVLCRVRMAQVIELFDPETRDLTSLEALQAAAAPQGSVLQPPPSAFLQIELGRAHGTHYAGSIHGSARERGHVYVARKARAADVVLPQFLVLSAKQLTTEAPTATDAREYDATGDGASASDVLGAFQRDLEAEVAAFHARLHAEIDPTHARLCTQLIEQTKDLDEQLAHQRGQIERERKAQDQLVRALHVEPVRRS